jgi:HSP20 family protein
MTRRTARSPVPAVALLQQEVNDLFHRLARIDRSDRLPGSEWGPAVDVYETRDRLVVAVEVPGLPPESLRLVFRDRALVVGGERRARRAGAGVSFLCVERPQGRFERVIPIDVAVDIAHATATLESGLLTVSLPRMRERRGRETPIPIEWKQDE